MKCFITSCTRKTTNLYFKRYGLKKYGKKVRENEIIYNVMHYKSRLNSDKIWKIQKKSKLNSEKI